MSENNDKRQLKPITDGNGQIERWECLSCAWAAPGGPVAIKPDSLIAVYSVFDQHDCGDYNGDKGTAGDTKG